MNDKNKKTIKDKNIGKVIICILCIVLTSTAVGSYNTYKKIAQNKEKIRELESQLKEEKARKKDAKAYEKYTNSKEYKERIARTRLGLIYPDEIILEGKSFEGDGKRIRTQNGAIEEEQEEETVEEIPSESSQNQEENNLTNEHSADNSAQGNEPSLDAIQGTQDN